MKKILFIISFLALINCYAENWLNHSKILSKSSEAFSLKADCERTTNEKCFDLGDYPSSVYKEVNIDVDDFNKPKYSKRVTYTCGEYCQSLWNQGSPYTDCNSNETAVLNLELKEIYCSKLSGYEKKKEKSIAIDPDKLTQFQNDKNLIEAEKAKENELSLALKRMDHGRRVIALMITRNNLKTLTNAQIQQMNNIYMGIKTLLDTGSLKTAKDAIGAITPDGTLVTTQDKQALIEEINKFPGLN